ncbi:MAG: hypothetical protein AAFN63_17600 [Pseudomonadota bacterium]
MPRILDRTKSAAAQFGFKGIPPYQPFNIFALSPDDATIARSL